MKLQLNHISGYLPYGLKCLTSKHQIKYGQRHELLVNGLAIDVDGNLNIEFLYDDDLLFSNNLNTVKPILYPMSHAYNDHRIEAVDMPSFSVRNHTMEWPYRTIIRLYELHYDLHGLIEKDLAVNKLEL